MSDVLFDHIAGFAANMPRELIERLARTLVSSAGWADFYSTLQRDTFSRISASELDAICHLAEARSLVPDDLALALRAASAVEWQRRQSAVVELVWTGPTYPPFEFRRTDEVLMEMITGARSTLTLVSFVFYQVDRLTGALSNALDRGVDIRMFAESKNLTEGALAWVYGDQLIQRIKTYYWNRAAGHTPDSTQQGVLHAKAAVADRRQLLISSANLSEFAMSANMELGLLVTGGELPLKVDRMFSDLISRDVFLPYRSR